MCVDVMGNWTRFRAGNEHRTDVEQQCLGSVDESGIAGKISRTISQNPGVSNWSSCSGEGTLFFESTLTVVNADIFVSSHRFLTLFSLNPAARDPLNSTTSFSFSNASSSSLSFPTPNVVLEALQFEKVGDVGGEYGKT